MLLLKLAFCPVACAALVACTNNSAVNRNEESGNQSTATQPSLPEASERPNATEHKVLPRADAWLSSEETLQAAGDRETGVVDLGRYPPNPKDGEYYDDYYLNVLARSSSATKVAVWSEGKGAGLTGIILVDCTTLGLRWLGLENFDTRPDDSTLADELPTEIRESLEQKVCRK